MKQSIVALVVLVGSGAALAERASDARAHYQRATAHFAVGDFAEAAEEYQAAYKLKQDPALLYDAAQAFRLAGKPEKALILYRNYVQLYPREPNIGEVQEQIVKLKSAISAADSAKNNPPTATAEPVGAASSASPEPIAEAPRKPPLYKKWWVWTIAGGVAAGVAIGLGVGLTTRSTFKPALGTTGPAALTVRF
jgi:tetratricopeptide (TPR) repeat protein